MSFRTVSYTAVSDADGIKTSIASATQDTTYLVADFNGAVVLTGGVLNPPRSVTISRSSSANAYSVNNIVVTGSYGGAVVTENIAQPHDDGNDTLVGVKLYDHITSIFVPANAAGTGAFTFGVRDVGAQSGDTLKGIRPHAAGSVVVRYGEATSAPTDTIPYAAGDLRRDDIRPTRIVGTTSIGVTVYL